MLQAKPGRTGKQKQSQNSPNLGKAFWTSPVEDESEEPLLIQIGIKLGEILLNQDLGMA